MKFLIIASLIAIALASPIDDKAPPARKLGPSDNAKGQVNPVPLNSAPLSPSPVDLHPLNKRETPKPSNSKKDQPSVVAAAPTAQKVDEKKTSDITRKTRDTAQKNAPTVASSNAQAVKSNNQATPQQAQSQASKKTREVPKPEDVKKTPTVNSQKSQSVVTSAPAVARVPLASTNSRSKRDAPKAAAEKNDQKQAVPSQTTDKRKSSDVPASVNTKPKRDTTVDTPQTQSSKYDNQAPTGVRRPAPVDQILKHKTQATDSTKVAEPQTQKS